MIMTKARIGAAHRRALGVVVATLLPMVVQAQALPAAEVPPPTAPLGVDAVVAERGAAVLTLGEIDAKVRTMPPEMRGGYLSDPDRIARLVDSMLIAEQVAIEARKQQLDSNAEYQADLALLGTELLSGRLVRAHVESVKAPNFDNLAQERYLADSKQFTPPPKREFRQVLLSTNGRDEAAAKDVAKKIYDRAKAGEDFEALIAEYAKSEGKHLASGTVDNTDESQLDTTFAIAMHGLKKVGDLVGPVRSRFGYHVIRLEKVQTFPTPSFEQVKDSMVTQMRNRFLEEEKNRFLNRYSQLDTKLDHTVINTLPTRYRSQVAEAAAAAAAAGK